MIRVLVAAVLAVACVAACTTSDSGSSSFASYAVGFEPMDIEAPAIGAGDVARPLRIALWRPSEPGRAPATIGALAEALCAPPVAADGAELETCIRASPELSDVERSALASTTGGAAFGAAPLDAPAPLILLDGGLGGRGADVVLLAPALAARGYAVAFAAETGALDDYGFDPQTLRRKADNLIAVVDALAARPDVDVSRVGVIGWSFGGAATGLVAIENARVRAFVSLDGATRYQYGVELLEVIAGDGVAVPAPQLQLLPGLTNEVEKDDGFRMRGADHWLIEATASRFDHASFSDQRDALLYRSGVEPRPVGWLADRAAMIALTADFLDAFVRQDRRALARLRAAEGYGPLEVVVRRAGG